MDRLISTERVRRFSVMAFPGDGSVASIRNGRRLATETRPAGGAVKKVVDGFELIRFNRAPKGSGLSLIQGDAQSLKQQNMNLE